MIGRRIELEFSGSSDLAGGGRGLTVALFIWLPVNGFIITTDKPLVPQSIISRSRSICCKCNWLRVLMASVREAFQIHSVAWRLSPNH